MEGCEGGFAIAKEDQIRIGVDAVISDCVEFGRGGVVEMLFGDISLRGKKLPSYSITTSSTVIERATGLLHIAECTHSLE